MCNDHRQCFNRPSPRNSALDQRHKCVIRNRGLLLEHTRRAHPGNEMTCLAGRDDRQALHLQCDYCCVTFSCNNCIGIDRDICKERLHDRSTVEKTPKGSTRLQQTTSTCMFTYLAWPDTSEAKILSQNRVRYRRCLGP